MVARQQSSACIMLLFHPMLHEGDRKFPTCFAGSAAAHGDFGVRRPVVASAVALGGALAAVHRPPALAVQRQHQVVERDLPEATDVSEHVSELVCTTSFLINSARVEHIQF